MIAISGKEWIRDFGADHTLSLDNSTEKIREVTSGKMADVVVNSLGSEIWSASLDALGLNGRLVLFGMLTGANVSLALNRIYSKQIQIIGTTGGTRKELLEVISFANSLRIKVWKKY